MTGPGTDFPEDMTIDASWEVSTAGAGNWGELHDLNNYYILNGGEYNTMFHVCVNSIVTTCQDAADDYSLVYTLTVNYICSITETQEIN